MMNIFSNDNSNQVNNINSSVDSTSIITNSNDISSSETCNICNNKFTHNGYTEDLNGNWIMCSDSYQSQICSPSCGRKHSQSLNQIAKEMGVDLESNSSSFKDAPINNYGEGHISGDGKFYENNKCGLCNGTGIEKNRSSLTDEYGRICPMCDGKGVRSY